MYADHYNYYGGYNGCDHHSEESSRVERDYTWNAHTSQWTTQHPSPHTSSQLFHNAQCLMENRHDVQSLPQKSLAPDKETLKFMLIECLKKLIWDIEHVNPRTNKIMIDQSIETMQVAFRMRLKREGI